eukprot:gene24885-10550_t
MGALQVLVVPVYRHHWVYHACHQPDDLEAESSTLGVPEGGNPLVHGVQKFSGDMKLKVSNSAQKQWAKIETSEQGSFSNHLYNGSKHEQQQSVVFFEVAPDEHLPEWESYNQPNHFLAAVSRDSVPAAAADQQVGKATSLNVPMGEQQHTVKQLQRTSRHEHLCIHHPRVVFIPSKALDNLVKPLERKHSPLADESALNVESKFDVDGFLERMGRALDFVRVCKTAPLTPLDLSP